MQSGCFEALYTEQNLLYLILSDRCSQLLNVPVNCVSSDVFDMESSL